MLTKIIRSFKFFLSYISVLTMVLTPVAQGAQAESVPKETLQNAINEIGLNRQMTIGEFFQKNKHLLTDGIRKQVEPMMEKYKDQMMPTFEIAMLQNSNGEKTPVIRIADQGQIFTMQIFQDENRAMKFDNTDLSLQDILNYNLMVDKLYYHEPRLRKLAGDSDLVKAQDFSRTKELPSIPSISIDVWKKYSVQDKAKYIYNLRRLWVNSRFVIESSKNQSDKGKKTSDYSFFKYFFISDAEARSKGAKIGDYAKGSKMSSSDSNACIIAGNISEYERNGSCSVAKVKTNYESNRDENVIAEAVFNSCPSGKIACNPYIYGVQSDGKGFCIQVDKSENFQKATWSGFGCDKLSPLGKPIEILNDPSDKKKTDRYADENYKIKPDEIENEYKKILAEESDDGPYHANIENYLKNMIKVPEGKSLNFKDEMDDSIFKQIASIKNVFDKEIKKAREICVKAAEYKKNEKNFYGACDQLQRRFLLIGEFLKKKPGCKPGSTFDDLTLKCNCENGESVNPGAQCKKIETPATTTTEGAKPDSETQQVDQGKCDTPCDKNQICKNLNTAKYGGRDKWQCVPNDIGTSSVGSIFSKIWSYAKWPVYIIGGLFIGKKVIDWLSPKKPKRSSAADLCANGVVAACTTQCTNKYHVLSNGVCKCPGCAPTTSLVDQVTCACSSASTAVVSITCDDGVTIVSNRSDCPVLANVKCPDGSYVTNINSCPNSSSSKATSSSTGQ